MNSLQKLWERRKAKTKEEQKKLTSAITEDAVSSKEESEQLGVASHSTDKSSDQCTLQNVKYGSFKFNQWSNSQNKDNSVGNMNNASNQQNFTQEQTNQEHPVKTGPCDKMCYTNLALSNDSGDLYTAGYPEHKCDNYNGMFSKKRKIDPDNGPKLTVFIERDGFHQKEFDYIYGKQIIHKENIYRKIIKQCRCSPISFILSLFPVLSWLPKYRVKEYLLADVITGFTLAILQIPQGMAYGLLATVGAINGLYVSFFPVIVYFIMGTSRHISIGTFAVISIMLSNAADKIGAVTTRSFSDMNATNTSMENKVEDGSFWPPTRLEVVVSMAVIVGIIQIVMGAFRLGALSVILSDQLVSGFTTGAAIHVATSQLKDLFGINIPRRGGPLQLVYTYIDIFKSIHTANLAAIIVSAISIFLLTVVKEQVNDRYRHKLKMPIPIDLIITIAVTVISYYMKFESNYKMSVMGPIPTGLPVPSLPRIDIGPELIADGFSIGIVVFAIGLSLAKLFAKKHGYTIYPNQELIALGSANVASSFFSCFPCAVSLSRSLVVERTGGKTQVAALISCVFILVVLLFLSPLFYHLPKCILSCIILVALKGMFLQFKDFWAAWKISRLDAIIWMVAFLSVVLINIDLGLLIGVAFSLFIVLQRIVSPNKSLLGNIPNTEIYVNVERYKECIELKDIKIFHFGGALCFLNKEIFKSFLMENISQVKSRQMSDLKDVNLPNPKNVNLPSFAMQRIYYVILDCSSFAFLDLSGGEMLLEVENELKEDGITLILADCSVPVYEMLEKFGFLAKPDNKGHQYIFPTIHDAVLYCQSTYNTHL